MRQMVRRRKQAEKRLNEPRRHFKGLIQVKRLLTEHWETETIVEREKHLEYRGREVKKISLCRIDMVCQENNVPESHGNHK